MLKCVVARGAVIDAKAAINSIKTIPAVVRDILATLNAAEIVTQSYNML